MVVVLPCGNFASWWQSYLAVILLDGSSLIWRQFFYLAAILLEGGSLTLR